jgi:hypothetical protein
VEEPGQSARCASNLAVNTVNLDKLGKKLRREVVGNPKKAALLGLVTVLALYFWAPLLRGWFLTDKAADQMATEAAPAVVVAGAQVVAATPTATDKPAAALPSWQQVVEWMHKDPRTMTAPPLMQTRDPFQAESDKPETTLEEKIKAKPPVVAPSAAGLVLTSTIIGTERRLAQINGKPYTVGQTIEVAKDKDSTPMTYKLIVIDLRRAVLEAEGEHFELTIPEPGQSDKIQFLGAVNGR